MLIFALMISCKLEGHFGKTIAVVYERKKRTQEMLSADWAQ